jgi:hypothetical protein
MPFVDLFHFKNNSTEYMSQKMSGKKIIRENISKKSVEKNPKIP